MTRTRRGEGGFTLVEIMISLVISSLLVAMILSIFTSMSAAYRTQQQVAELQQVLQAAQATVEGDLRQVGFHCPQGFMWAGSVTLVPALNITDGGTGAQLPDQLAIYYGDPSAQAQVQNWASLTSMTVDAIDPTWVIGDKVLLSVGVPNGIGAMTFEAGATRPPEEPVPGDTVDGAATLTSYYACVLQITNINGLNITFSTAAPWGKAGNTQCTAVVANATAANKPMLYKFVARAYRIDPTRKNLSVFQQSPSGGLVANDWTDLGLGFTNFQVASRWYEFAGIDNADSDTDPRRNWYSGAQQSVLSTASATATPTPAVTVALQVSLSFVVRTTHQIVDGTVTAATPQIQDPANVNFNDLGDSPAVTLAGVADASRPVELRGNNIYRYATIKVDTRNLGTNR